MRLWTFIEKNSQMDLSTFNGVFYNFQLRSQLFVVGVIVTNV